MIWSGGGALTRPEQPTTNARLTFRMLDSSGVFWLGHLSVLGVKHISNPDFGAILKTGTGVGLLALRDTRSIYLTPYKTYGGMDQVKGAGYYLSAARVSHKGN